MAEPFSHPSRADGHDPVDRGIDELVAEYLDLLNSGHEVDPFAILSEHPEHGPEIVERLEAFVDLDSTPSSSSAREPLGTLGDYTLRRQIGHGGMGVVYEAWQSSLDRHVALKILPPGIAADAKSATRFLREAQIAAKLAHPNIAGVFASGVEGATPYYAMEYIEGDTLARILSEIRDADPETETPFGKKDSVVFFGRLAEAFADVADGLQHAHVKGVTHRDIKPSNLILDGQGRLRILDFGLARLEGQDSLTLSGDVVGTPLYMSPEQARRRKIRIDHRTDVYSLGATMYEAICGKPPFRGKDHADTLSQIIEREPTAPGRLNPRIPKDLETIVLKCLRKEAGDRYGTAEALGQDLRRFVRGDPIEARPPGRLDAWQRRIRRHWIPLVIAASFSCLLAVTVALYLRARGSELERLREQYPVAVRDLAVQLDAGRFLHEASTGRRKGPLGDPASFIGLPGTPTRAVGFSSESLTLRQIWSAVEEFQDWTHRLPRERDAHYHLARGYQTLGRTEAAIAEARQALKIDSRFIPAREILRDLDVEVSHREPLATSWQADWLACRKASRRRDWSTVVEHSERLLRLADEPYLGAFADALLRRGTAYLELEDWDRAQEDFVRAVDRTPGSIEPQLLLGKSYLQSGNASRARDLFERLVARSPKNALWVIALLLLLEAPGDALEWVEALPAGAQRELVRVNLYEQNGMWKQAAEVWQQIVEVDPDNLDAKRRLALALFRVIFLGSGVIPPPGMEACGTDLTADALGCESPPDSCP